MAASVGWKTFSRNSKNHKKLRDQFELKYGVILFMNAFKEKFMRNKFAFFVVDYQCIYSFVLDVPFLYPLKTSENKS